MVSGRKNYETYNVEITGVGGVTAEPNSRFLPKYFKEVATSNSKEAPKSAEMIKE